jgi:hypothetical protein
MAHILTNGVKSTQIKDSWDFVEFMNSNYGNEAANMYSRVAAMYRAANKTAEAVANMPFVLMDKSENEYDTSSNWQNKIGILPNPVELFRLFSLSLFFTNTAYGLVTKNALGQGKNVYYLVPTSMRPITDSVTGELTTIERVVNGVPTYYKPDDPSLIRIWRLDHTTELLPSKNTDAEAASAAAGVMYYSDFFTRNFFERGGVKPTIVSVKGMLFPDGKERAEGEWDKFVRNVSKRLAKIVNGDAMDVKPFGAGVDDLKDSQVYNQALANIAIASGMPLSLLLANSANYATAQIEYMTWFRDKIVPNCNFLAYELNRQLFSRYGLHMMFTPETTDPEQEDEVARASAMSTFVDFINKCPSAEIALESAATFGYELTDGLVEAIKKYFADKEQRAVELQAQMQPVTEEAEEEKEEEEEGVEEEPPVKLWTPTLDEYNEMRVWREVALRRQRRGEALDFEYTPHYGGLPEDVTNAICLALPTCQTADDVKSAFEFTMGERRDDGELKALADALNNYKEQQPLTINVTANVPEPKAIVTVQVPELPKPNTEVNNQIES